MAVPTEPQVQRMKLAVIYKAARFLVLPEAPLGVWGEMTEAGIASVRPDYQIAELLKGLRFRNWAVDLEGLVDTETVIRVGLGHDPTTFPADKIQDVERAIDAAVSWVAHEMLEGIGIA